MRAFRPLTLRCLLVAALPVLAVPAGAQRMPPPPAPQEQPIDPGPRPGNRDAFINAYRRAGEPTIVIWTIIVPGAGDGAGPADVALAERFSGRIIGHFTATPDVHVISPATLELARQGEISRLVRNDELAAAAAIGGKAEADVVILVRLIEAPGNTFAASYVVVDQRRGQTLDQHSWDMLPDGGGAWPTPHLARYAQAVADRIMRRFDLMYPREAPALRTDRDALGSVVRRISVQVIGDTSFDAPIRLRRVIREVEGVVEVGPYEEQRLGPGRSLIAFEVKFQGDPIDLQFGIMLGAREELGLKLFTVGAAEGRLTMRAEAPHHTSREQMLSGGPENAENRTLRQALLGAYAAEGRPRLAVMINPAADADPDAELKYELSLARQRLADAARPPGPAPAPGPGEGGISIVVSQATMGVGGGRDDRRGERDALDTAIMANEIGRRLHELGLTTVDVTQARQNVGRDQDPSRAMGDGELAWLVSRQQPFDVVISGAGRIMRHTTPPVLRYTFRAFRMQDARGLAFTTVQKEIQGGNVAAMTGELASEAVGRLAVQMLDGWKPPRSLEVQVAGAQSDREVFAIMDSLVERFPDSIISATYVSRESAREGGLGRFRIEHRSDYDALVREILAAEGLPFQMVAQSSTRQRLALRLTRLAPADS